MPFSFFFSFNENISLGDVCTFVFETVPELPCNCKMYIVTYTHILEVRRIFLITLVKNYLKNLSNQM